MSTGYEYEKRATAKPGLTPHLKDHLITPYGCYREVTNLEPLRTICSNPKTCPHGSVLSCDLSEAVITRHGKVIA